MTLDYETQETVRLHPVVLEFPGPAPAQVSWWHNLASGHPIFFNVLSPKDHDIVGRMMCIPPEAWSLA